jgi:hypothetical protein
VGEHSGLLQLDVDDVGMEHAPRLRDRIITDPHVQTAWLSPGGGGVKGTLRIPAVVAGHRRSFAVAARYMKSTYGVEIDPKCSDPCRLCFVSHDPELKWNGDAVPLPIAEDDLPTRGGAIEKRELSAHSNSSECLTAESDSYVLCNTSTLFQDFPGLRSYYQQHVHRRLGSPQPGHRNKALVELVAGTFCVVCPRFVLDFANVFYDANGATFAGYDRTLYTKEANNLLEGCLTNYPAKSLSARERELYAALDDESERATFRICHSLARCESDASVPPPLFFLSAEQLGIRIDEVRMQAWRIQQHLKEIGAIAEVAKGAVWSAGQKPRATVWRWCL